MWFCFVGSLEFLRQAFSDSINLGMWPCTVKNFVSGSSGLYRLRWRLGCEESTGKPGRVCSRRESGENLCYRLKGRKGLNRQISPTSSWANFAYIRIVRGLWGQEVLFQEFYMIGVLFTFDGTWATIWAQSCSISCSPVCLFFQISCVVSFLVSWNWQDLEACVTFQH